MSTDITPQYVWYVNFIDGKHPSRIRRWPQAKVEAVDPPTDLPEGLIVGRAPERSALLVLGVEQDSVQIGARTRVFRTHAPTPKVASGGMCAPMTRTRRTIVQGWTADNEGAEVYLVALQPIESCNAATAEAPGMRWRPSNLQAGMEAFVVSKTVLNVRRGPDCDTDDVGDLAPGTVIKVLEGPRCSADGRVWWRIKHNGKDRWVCESEPAGTACVNTPANADDNPLEWNLLPLKVALPSG